MLTFDPATFECVTTTKQLARWVKRIESSKSFCIDTETTGLDIFSDSLVGVALAVEDGTTIESCYIPVAHHSGLQLSTGAVLTALAPTLANPRIGKVFHNALYDLAILAQPRYDMRIENIHDTMFMQYALTGHLLPLGMDFLAKKHFNWNTIKFSDVVSKRPGRVDFRDVPLDEATYYAAEDTAVTLALAHGLQHSLKKENLWEVYTRDRKLIPVLHAMKQAGVAVDLTLLSKLEERWTIECATLERLAHETAGTVFNLNSPKQIIEQLRARGLELTPDKDGKYSTDKDALDELPDDDLVKLLREYKGKYKLLSTYARAIPEKVQRHSRRVHPNFPAVRTKTGRFASNDPNLQNIPTRTKDGELLREAFVAGNPNWRLLSADYSQIEYRVLAHITEDPYLVHCFKNGIDLHAKMASDVRGGEWTQYNDKKDKARYKVRTAMKNVNFAVIYGAGATKVARMSEIEVPEALVILDAHREMAPNVYTWKDDTWELARAKEHVVTLFGRRIQLPYINSKNSELKSHAERLAINGVVQGSAADLMRMAMVAVHDVLHAQTKILLTVHDELVIETHKDHVDLTTRIVKNAMETAADHLVEWRVPIIAEVGMGKNWKEAK